MLSQLERTADRICSMDRDALISYMSCIECDLPLDFTPDFLNAMSLERLQHIALAASLHEKRRDNL